VSEELSELRTHSEGSCWGSSISRLCDQIQSLPFTAHTVNQSKTFYPAVHRLWLEEMAWYNSYPLFCLYRLGKAFRQNLKACAFSAFLRHSINPSHCCRGRILFSLLSSSIQSWCALDCREGFPSLEQYTGETEQSRGRGRGREGTLVQELVYHLLFRWRRNRTKNQT